MTDKLPPNLLALFAPRPPLRFLPAQDHAPKDRRTPYISGLADFMPALEDYKKTDVYEPTESHHQRKDRIMLEKQKQADWLTSEGVKSCMLWPLHSSRRMSDDSAH
jgi:U1 small nuclear ribonucleoprotein